MEKEYQSKKDENVKAKLLEEDEKYGTVQMVYTSGENEGKQFSITKSTLNRWWKKVSSSVVEIDNEIINTPYPEPKEQKYIPKPKSVIEYEAKQQRRHNSNLPSFETIISDVGQYCSKINENYSYVRLNNNSDIARISTRIKVCATFEFWEILTNNGFTSSANKDKNRPYAININTVEEYEKLLEVIKCIIPTN